MGNEQSQQEGSEGMTSRVGTGAPAGVTPPPPATDMAPNRTGVEEETIGVAPPPGVDLSNLSEEERKMILSVMARAQDLDNDITQRRRSAELSRAESLPNSVTAHQVVCLACHVTELTNTTSAKCTKCGKTVCEKCGQHPTSADGKKYPWICNACARHHIQASRTRVKGQAIRTNQDDVMRSDSAEDDSTEKKTQRKEEAPMRRQTRSPAKSRRESVEVVITDDKQQPEARIKSAHKRNDGIVRAARPVVVVNGEVTAQKPATKAASVEAGRTETPVETAQSKKPIQTEVKTKKTPETKPAEAVTKPVVSPKKFEATSSPKVSKKAEATSTPQKAEVVGSAKKKDISSSPKRSDIVRSPKRAEVTSTGPPPKTEVTISPKRTEPASSPQKTESSTSPKITPSPKRTEMTKPQVNAAAIKIKPMAKTTSPEPPTSSSKKANEVLTKPAEVSTTSESDKDFGTSTRIITAPPTTSDIVPISTSPQMTITSPVFDRPIISVDVVIVSKLSDSLTTHHDASKSDTTDTMATLNTITTTTKSKTGGSTRSSVVSITPSQSVLSNVSPTMEDKPIFHRVSDEYASATDSIVFHLVKKPEECSVNFRQSIENKMAENWEQNAISQLNELSADTRDQLTKDLVKPDDSSVNTTEIRSDLPSRIDICSSDVSLSYHDQSDANYQTKELNQSKQKPKTIDLQSQKKVKQKVETADWSPVSDLSPIQDVSPSLEAAEQEMMEQFRGRSDSEGSNNHTSSSSAIPRATSGTISGMLADFNKALELLDTSPIEDPQKQDKSVVSPSQSPQGVPATCSSLVSVTTEPSIYHPVRQQRSQQQPGTPRRTRRLPQPTMEQMQAAVAMAAHGPRDKQSIAMTPVTTSLPVTTSQRPVSPIMPWRTIDSYLMSDVEDYDTRSLIQPSVSLHEDTDPVRTAEDATTANALDTVALAEQAPTADQSTVGTEQVDASDRADEVISTPVGQVDTELPQLSFAKENDGPTDLDIIKLKLRRKLPCVPSPDYGKLPSPNKRVKDRTRTLSTGATPLFTQEWSNGDSVEEPITTSADDSSSVRLNSQKRSTSADGDYVCNLSPTRPNVSYSPEPGHGLGGRKELSVSQGNLPYLRTPSPLLGSDNRQLVGTGTNLPAYMKTLKQQLRDELKAVTEERKRVKEVRSKERDYYMSPENESNYVSQQWQETDTNLQYDNLTHRSLLHSTPPTSTVRRQSSPHTSPRKGRRRHTSDVALRPFSPIKEDRSTEEAKPNKIAPTEDETQQTEADVTLNKDSTGKEIEHYFQQYSGELAKQAKEMKRVTIAQKENDGSTVESSSFSRLRMKNGSNLMSTTPPSSSDSWMKSSNSCYLTTERKKQRKEKKSRKPRSWHPSPYVSEDEDEQMTREEKKAKIKAEIARRRQQIEENARLHEELVKLAKSRENAEQMEYKNSYEYKSTPSISEHSTMYRTSHTSPSTRSTESMLPGDTTSVLQAIDEILRKETQGVSSVRSSQYYNPAPPNIYSTMPRSRYTPRDTSWYQREPPSTTMQFPDTTAEDESIARIASTFPAENAPKTGLLISKPKPHLDLETPPENDLTPPMPLLPDMPSRSRKLLEDLGSSPIGGQPVQPQYRQCSENERVPHVDVEPMPEPTMMRQMRKVQRQIIVRTPQKYEFPIKRILLTRDPKDRSVSGNGLGMKVIGGKEIPGGNGLLGAYVAKVCPGGVVETMGEVKEGNQVLEWNGVPLTGRTYEEVQKIISVTADEVEIVIRSDFNMLESIPSCQGLSPARDGVSPCSTPSDSLKAGTPGARTPSPCSSLTARRVSSPASTSSSISTPTYDNIAPSHLGNAEKVQAVSRDHYRRNTVQTIPRFIGNHYGPPPQPTIERRES